jgi:diguanylate cyclase (GGDEF)-like protein/PAS domain S-box-containing protein
VNGFKQRNLKESPKDTRLVEEIRAAAGSRVFILSIAVVACFWLLDPVIDSILIGEGTFSTQLLRPSAAEIYFRALVSLLVLGFGLVASILLARSNAVSTRFGQVNAELNAILDNAPECVKTVNRDGTLASMNAAGMRLIQASERVEGLSVFDLIAPEHLEEYRTLHQRVLDGQTQTLQYETIGLQGKRLWVETHAAPLYDGQGQVSAHIAVTRDIGDKRALIERLDYAAHHDPLTGLANRREMEQRVNLLLNRLPVAPGQHAFSFIDLDQFKVINDTCGHSAGDELLRQLGVLLQKKIRQGDTLARLGGDEFGLLMEYCDLENAEKIVTEINTLINQYQFSWEDLNFNVSASIGLVALHDSMSDFSELMKLADVACYVAKDKGRNHIHVQAPDDLVMAEKRGQMQWVPRIREALEGDLFRLFGQSIVAIDGSGEEFVEVLLKMKGDQDQLIPAGAFLPAAERYNLIHQIDTWVVDSVLRILSEDRNLRDSVKMFTINLSGQSLVRSDFEEFLLERFRTHAIDGAKICFEITETSAIQNIVAASSFLNAVKRLGCRIALDDFGSGFSSYGYLKNLPVDYLKIDGFFVRDIIQDPVDHTMVKSINEIGQVMNMKTMAEFVENDEIKARLRKIGVNYVQGYGISRPRPLHDFSNSGDPLMTQRN